MKSTENQSACLAAGLAAFLASSFAAEAAMGPWPFVVALFACAGKEALYRVTAAVGVKRRSAILIASAKHHRSDALSSVVALLGVTAWVAATMTPFFYVMKVLGIFRVPKEVEELGLDDSKHGGSAYGIELAAADVRKAAERV